MKDASSNCYPKKVGVLKYVTLSVYKLSAVLVVAAAVTVSSMATLANAGVSISATKVLVTTPTMIAEINRDPLQVKYYDANGQVILEQTATKLFGTPFLSLDPQPLGTEFLPTPSNYAPFQYEVGWEKRKQWLFGPFVGNLRPSLRGGVFHSARKVISAKANGEGVVLELATTEWGRKLVVHMEPDPMEPGSIRVTAKASPSKDVIAMGDSFKSHSNEEFYGFGGQHNALSQRGRTLHSWTVGQNYGVGFLQGILATLLPMFGEFYQFPSGENPTYYSQALFISSKGYGFSVNEDNLIRWRMATDDATKWQFSATTTSLDYTVSAGDPALASSKVTKINGRHKLPPLWAHGASLTRTFKLVGETTESYTQAVLKDVEEIESRNLPIKSYVFEGAGHVPLPIVKDVIQRLKTRNIHIILYLRAFAGKDENNTLLDPNGDIEYDLAIKNGYVATNKDGEPYVFISPYIKDSVMFDFTNPRTVTWWYSRVNTLLDLGADGFMLDFGEQVLDGMHFANGQTGQEMHQSNPIYMTRVTRAATDAYEAANPGREIFFYNRSGSSGRQGSAAYEQSNFAGDGTTDWSQAAGLPAQTTDMLNRAIGGAYGFNTDIGGYADYIVSPQTTEELFIRWSQWAALSPFFRVHNSSLAGPVMPWTFGDATLAKWLDAVSIHDKITPLIRAQWNVALNGGAPPLQPLWMAAPGEAGAASEEQAWMIGANFLAAPVVKQGALTKTVYLPTGCWNYGPYGTQYNGGTRVTVPAPLKVIPYFTRCGTTDPLAI